MSLRTWQERAQMRRQRQLEEQAEAARRSRVAVTIDLLGRRVSLFSLRCHKVDNWQHI